MRLYWRRRTYRVRIEGSKLVSGGAAGRIRPRLRMAKMAQKCLLSCRTKLRPFGQYGISLKLEFLSVVKVVFVVGVIMD